MGETHQQATTSSRLGMRSGDGEIVEVQGGHIVRSTGRKDRHSKVCTAKGPRDRRVRLSAHTAIQFYDVQDRLGYDRPSKAVDWLIKKAKTAIDELAQLPAWHPTATTTSTPLNQNAQHQHQHHQQQQENMNEESEDPIGVDAIASTSRRTNTPVGGTTSFLPPSLDRDIADTIKTFFPMVAPTETTSSSSIQFQNYPPDLLSRTSSTMNQDLRLSLHSFQDPIMLHHQQHQHHNHHHNDQALFAGTTALGFDGWPEHHHSEEHGRLQRMVAWNAGADTGNSGGGGGGGGGGFIFNSPSLSPSPAPALFGHSQYLSQRGPLQSSNNPSIRAWIDPPITSSSVTDHHPHQHHQYLHHHYLPPAIHQSSFSGTGYSSGGFSGFRIPARIQGEEEHDGVSDKPSSASSDSRH